MKIRFLKLILTLAAIGLFAFPSYAASTSSSPVSSVQQLTTVTWTTLSDHRWLERNGTVYFVLSTNSQIKVKQSYLNGGGNPNLIPFSEWGYETNASYTFESVPYSGYDTGSSISGSGTAVSITPGYGRYTDALAGRDYGPHGCMYLRGGVDPGYFYLFWSRWVNVSLMSDGGKWLCAEYGGGTEVTATRTSIGPWEEFKICSNNSDFWNSIEGKVESGDTISMLSAGPFWVCAEAGTLDTILADRSSAGSWEHFTISKTSGSGVIGTNDDVSILAHSSSKYWVAEDGAGTVVRANRTSVGPWETFTVLVH